MARSVTETAVGDVPDAALQLLPPHFAAQPLLSELPSYLTRFVR